MWFPVILSTIKFLLDIIVFLAVFVAILTSPIAAASFTVLAFVRYVLRRIYDTISYTFIRCCARQPIEDSWVAWRVAGPGVSKKFY